MRPEVLRLVDRGSMPPSTEDVERIREWQEALEDITAPVSDEEATALVELFPRTEDDCLGLAWSLLHLIETCPHWPLRALLQDMDKPWIAYLRQRCGLSATREQR